MNSDTSWYDEGQNHFKPQPSTSDTQRGRPPDVEMKEEKPNINVLEEVNLIDEEDDPQEALNSFHNFTRKKILLPLTGVEIHEEKQFLEALKQFKMILEEKVELLTLKKDLKEMLYKYLLFFASNYARMAILYKDQYLDVMEDILLFYCDVIKDFFRDQKRRNKKMRVYQEARRIKILLRDCLLKKIDRILHLLLKVKLAPEIEEYGKLWGDVYMYFLTKVPYKHTDDDILRGFIAFQKFKTIRVKSESAMIDKVMLNIYKKTTEELKKIPCLEEIMVRMKRDRLYTIRDMVARYMRYYKEKRNQTENFEMEDMDEDTVDVNVKEMRHLDLSGSLPCVPFVSNADSPAAQLFVERRNGVRRTVSDMATETSPQFEHYNTDFSLFDDDVAKIETPEEETVVVLDDEDDDVIVVCDNLRNVITIEDDDDNEELLHVQPLRSPSPREALSPDRVLRPHDAQSPTNITLLEKNLPPNLPEHVEISPPQNTAPSQSSLVNEPKGDTCLPPINVENTVPEKMLPKEATIPKCTALQADRLNVLVPKTVQPLEAQVSTRLVKKVDNSLRITINSVPYRESPVFASIKSVNKGEESPSDESPNILSEKSTSLGQTRPHCEPVEDTGPQNSVETVQETEKTVVHKEAELLLPKPTCIPPNCEKETVAPETASVSPCLDDLPPQKSTDEPTNQQVDKPESPNACPMEVEESDDPSKVPDQLCLQKAVSVEQPPLKMDLSGSANKTHENKSQDKINTNESIMEIDSPALSKTFENLEGVANSTMYEESVPYTTSISPIKKPVFEALNRRIESMASSNVTSAGTNSTQLGVLPSSKIPSDLEDSPDKDNEKRLSISVSDISNISSPLFECIDKIEAKNYFDQQKMVSRVSSLSSETETSTSTTSSSTSSSTSENITVGSSVNTSISTNSESQMILQISDTSSLNDSYNTKENTVIQLDSSAKGSDLQPEKDLSKHDESKTIQKRQTPEVIEKKTLEPKTYHPTGKILNKPRNYSNLTECFTKFTEELSVEDMLTSQTEELASAAQNVTVSTIDLVPSTENTNDVIIVKCRPIEPLKDEENIVSDPETITFSTNEVLAPSDEPIALLVSYSGSSQEESQHYLMCDPNFALAEEQVVFSSDERAHEDDDVSPSQQSDTISVDSNRNVQGEHIDGLSLSGSQPYTPQSSPSTRIEAVKADISKLDASSTTLEALDHQTLDSQHQEAAISKDDEKRFSKTAKPLEKISKVVDHVEKRRKSADISVKASKSRRKSSELSKEELSKQIKKRAEAFRDDLSQSLSTVKKITPQEVDEINRLPLKFSQSMDSNDTSQQTQTKLPVLAKVSQVKTNTSQPISKGSKPELSSVTPLDKERNNLTRSASFVEEKLHDLYIKEYGNVVSQPDIPQKVPSKRRESQDATPIRSLKMYAKDKPVKDLSLKSYKALIKDVSKHRSGVLRDVVSPLFKDKISQVPSRIQNASADILPQKDLSDASKGSLSQTQEVIVYDHSELFNNGIGGPIGKPLGGTDVDDNFLWDSDNDGREDAFSGTISVKPDYQLFQAKNGPVTPQKTLVSILKSAKPKVDNGPPKSPEKKVCYAKTSQSELYVELDRFDVKSYELDLKKKQQANELKRRRQEQMMLAQEMQEKHQKSLQRDQIVFQVYSKKAGSSRWFNKAKSKLTGPKHVDNFSIFPNVSSRDESNCSKGKGREQPVHRNGHKMTEKRKIRDFEADAEPPHRKKIALNTDIIDMEKNPKNHALNGKIIGPKPKSVMKPPRISPSEASNSFAIEENGTHRAAPSSPVRKTKSGRVTKKPRPDYDDVIKSNFNGASKVKKTVKFKR